MRHSPHCSACKEFFVMMISKTIGSAVANVTLDIPSHLGDYAKRGHYSTLQKIHDKIGRERGNTDFVKRTNLPPVDFFVPGMNQIIEFDEPQHFTALRALSLTLYPPSIKLGYDRNVWRKRCVELDRHDNSPVYRDEQRAWYDTLRDFAPVILGFPPIIRVFAGDAIWCEMNPRSRKDTKRFKSILGIQD